MRKCLILLAALAFVTPIHAATISVSAAISMKDALTDIATDYEKQSGDHVTYQFGASGQLAAQIEQGAPVDVFISAAQKQVDDLLKEKLLDPSTVRIVAGNALVLIVPASAAPVPSSFNDLTDDKRFKKIAVGDPKTVPAGDYAMQVLDALKLTDTIKSRLIQGSNVRQVLSYVELGEVDAGIVYKTDALEGAAKVKIAVTADPKLHKPIVYPGAVAARSASHEAAVKFLDFLKTDASRRKLADHGFTTPDAR